MTTISDYLLHDHHRCDELFALCEEAVNQDEWEKAVQQTRDYIQSMERHISMEEEVLFPAFEERSGITDGPTSIMKGEHQQMRGLFMELEAALEAGEKDEFLDTAETLLILIQQHNMKEESMLYPMCDAELGMDSDQIIADMESMGES